MGKHSDHLYGDTQKQRKEVILNIKQDDKAPITVEVMAESIKAISEGIKKLRQGRLNDDALILLVQHATPSVKRPGRYGKAKLSPKAIKAVLQGLEQLEQTYLKRVSKP